MKTIKAKKLTFTKTSIAQLDNFQKNQVKGGARLEIRETVGGKYVENCASWVYCEF